MARILVVDDSRIIRSTLRRILTEGGHEVVGEACNGKIGVELFAELNPDIVTVDITMPVMGGIETLKKILEINEDAQVIIVSAISEKMIVKEAIVLGAIHYITKPIDSERVLKIVEQVLEGE